MKQKGILTDWELDHIGGTYFLTGVIKDHPRQEEFKADRQMTSTLLSIDFQKKVAETLNTIYTLE